MTGKEIDAQSFLKKKYTKSLFFHCSNYKINLVVNYASKLPAIRNTIATIKNTVSFFRESPPRRNSIPTLQKLGETRKSEKYKIIRKFLKNFYKTINTLDNLSTKKNYKKTKKICLTITLCSYQTNLYSKFNHDCKIPSDFRVRYECFVRWKCRFDYGKVTYWTNFWCHQKASSRNRARIW